MTRRPALVITAVAFVAGVVVDVAIGATSPFPGYPAAIGLFGCIAIIIVSKWLGKLLLQRPEDYYPEDAPADRQEDLHGSIGSRHG